MIRSYSKPLAITHRHAEALRDPASFPVLVYQEKIDGSQFSFMKDSDGVLHFRSRRQPIDVNDPGMFAKGVEALTEIADKFTEGWTYRGEYLQKPKHNVIKYGRVPERHVILYDVDRGHCDYLSPDQLIAEGARVGLEVVPTWMAAGPDDSWLETESILGGDIAEGYVVKHYGARDGDDEVAMAKVVRQSFKEVHQNKTFRPKEDPIEQVIATYRTEARWQKAVQHLREAGELVSAPQDIGKVIKEACQDLEAECESEIKDLLWTHYRKKILKGATDGIAQWYKEQL